MQKPESMNRHARATLIMVVAICGMGLILFIAKFALAQCMPLDLSCMNLP